MLNTFSKVQFFQHRHPLSQKEQWDIHSVLGVLCHIYLPQAHVSAFVGHLRDHWIPVFRQLQPIPRYVVL